MSIEKKCKNCNSKLIGRFCFNCGQKSEQHVLFSDIKQDFLDEAFDYDARIFKTLKFLFARPGFLTIEYCNGKRVKYLQPIKLYILSSVFYYFVNSFIKSSQTLFILAHQIAAKLIDKKYYDIIQDIVYSYGQEIELLLFTPFTGLVLMILYKNTNKPFLHHMIASVHLSSFIFIFIGVINIFSKIFYPFHNIINIFYSIIPIYSMLMVKYIYGDSISTAILKTILIFISIELRNLIIFGIGFLVATFIH